MSQQNRNQHLFSFFVPDLTDLILSLSINFPLRISDENLFHRIIRVVRMNLGETCILFDRESHIFFKLLSTEGKTHLDGVILQKQKNKPLLPSITFWLPLLKKEYFQTALYSLAELGVNYVQPVITKKTQRKWGGKKEFDRSVNIMISAAEQSKSFAFPELHEPKTINDCCASIESGKSDNIFFDPAGERIATVIHALKKQNLILMVGPEGDLTKEEKDLLSSHEFRLCSLTPTILRSLQAAALSAGIIRSFLSN